MTEGPSSVSADSRRRLIDEFVDNHSELYWLKEKRSGVAYSVYEWGLEDHSAGGHRHAFVFCVDKEGFIIAAGYKQTE